MRTQCQFTVKRPEKRVDLTVAPEQQLCGVQVVEWVGLKEKPPLGDYFFFRGSGGSFMSLSESISTLDPVFGILTSAVQRMPFTMALRKDSMP
jgi:hypothetical protein